MVISWDDYSPYTYQQIIKYKKNLIPIVISWDDFSPYPSTLIDPWSIIR